MLEDVEGAWFTSHVNENLAEVAEVAELFDGSPDYLDTYDRHGLVGRAQRLAHNVHADRPASSSVLAEHGAGVAHCPTSNSALGSGLFPLRRHVEPGVRVALGLRRRRRHRVLAAQGGAAGVLHAAAARRRRAAADPAHLLYLATHAGAQALGLATTSATCVGKQFDAVWVRPPVGSTLDVALVHADGPDDALAKVFALGGVADTAGVWVGGKRLLG